MVVRRENRDRGKNRGTVPSRPLSIPGIGSHDFLAPESNFNCYTSSFNEFLLKEVLKQYNILVYLFII